MGQESHNKTAAFTITAGSLEATQPNSMGVESFFFEEHIDMVGVAQITLCPNSNGSFSDFAVGDDVEIAVSGNTRKWKGVITGFRMTLEGNVPKLTILAMDPLCKLASSRHTRVWPADGNSSGTDTVSDSDICSEVLSKANVDAGTVESVAAGPKYVFQRNESDLNFLKRLASRNGFVLRSEEGKIHFEALQTSGDAVQVDYKSVKALDFTWSPMWVPPKIQVNGYDYATKKVTKGEHSSFEAIGAGKDPVAHGNKKIWQADAHIGDVWVNADSAATAMAKGELERIGRNFLRGRMIVDGNAEFHPGVMIEVGGFASMNLKAVVVSSRHIVTTKPDDFRTEVTFMSNTAPA